ncbi:helix-turn-helix domain-containing protein [Streptomyces sp. NPDC052773]|uniref:helix-turn-helix domain-containing protein n=1 Tax=Streptomyces sp. NPDC052773 TaxID=3365693 RepID=UPI0037D75AAE
MCHPAWGRARTAARRSADLVALRRVRDRIDREYARPLDVPALARDARMPAGDLSRRFRLAYGASPYAYLMRRRVERATALLRHGGLGVTEVRVAVGCCSPAAFSAHFTERTGMSPSAYRRHATRPPSVPRHRSHASVPARTA